MQTMTQMSLELYDEIKKFQKAAFVHQLREVRMRVLGSYEDNIEFLKYLLKHAKELTSITMSYLLLEYDIVKKVGKKLNSLRDEIVRDLKTPQEPYSLPMIFILPI